MIKYTPIISKKEKGRNPYRISDKYSSATRPIRMPLHFKNLKSNTKYKIFLQNSEGDRQEDITRFCSPYGVSILLNNNKNSFDELISTPGGELFIFAKPFGADTVDLTNDNWDRHWRFANKKTQTADVGRRNFVIVESAKVSGDPASTDKVKIISDKIFSMSLEAEPETNSTQRKIKQQLDFDVLQTFFVDPNSTNNAQTVDMTDVTLYFRNKPDRELNRSKRSDPSVTVALIDVENDIPNVEKQYKDSIVNVPWSFIQSTSDASAGTRFEFKSPIRLEPGRFYAIAVLFDDADYVLWSSVLGDVLVNTEEISPGSSKDHRGTLYRRSNASSIISNKNFDTIFTKKENIDLKFDIHVAEYDLTANVDIRLVNIDQEFLLITDTTNDWIGSEFVFKQTANNVNGTVAVSAGELYLTGTSTTFQDDLRKNARIVLEQGANLQIVEVGAVTNNTFAYIKSPALFTMTAAKFKVTPTGRVDHFDYTSKLLFLKNSSANSTIHFANDDIIQGVESGKTATISKVGAFPISTFNSNFDINLPSDFNLTATYKFSVPDSSNSSLFTIDTDLSELNFFKPNSVRDYDGVVLSRSLEARNESTMFDQDDDPTTSDGKSALFNLDFEYAGNESTSFVSPVIDISHVSLASKQWKIDNDATGEHTNNGNALTKHISKRLTMKEGQEAEDIRVIQNAYRPLQTDIKVYAKVLNIEDPDAFEDKNWTELTRIAGESQFSEKNNFNDFREFEYSFPATIPSSATLDGTITTTTSSATITGVNTTFSTDLSEGDIIKIYSPFFENNYGFFSVVSIDNDTQLVINEPITNNDIIGTGFKLDTVTTPQTAFLNPLNLNIVRYFGADGQLYDGYSTVAIKTVLLSEDQLVTPRVDDNRIISISA